ncbi:MAG: hypothetical protein J6S86_03900 [Alphaproteobacteria bacterium]|nr:hypothetical protein [Alphaproteobacteria bacterium]
MKLNMKTLCSIGALLLCSESVLAMAEIRNENRSAYQMASISSDKKNESTGNVKVCIFPSIANFVAGMVSIHNIHLDNNTLSSIRDIIEYHDTFIKVHDLLDGILDTGLDRQQLLEERNVYQNLLDSTERRRIAAEDEAIESAAQMFEEAEREAMENEAIESATQMFEEAEKEAAEAEAERQRIAQEKAEREEAQAASQVISRESYYSKFGQFFKSMWSRFTDSRWGRFLKNIGQTLFSNR